MKYIKELKPVFKSAKNDLLLLTDEDQFVSTNPEGVMEALNEDLQNFENLEDFMNALSLKSLIETKGGIKKIYIFIKDEEEEN